MTDEADKTRMGAAHVYPLSFRAKPHVDARTGDIVFIAYMGLRFIRCRVKRSALKPFTDNPAPSQADLLAAFADHRYRIERLVEREILKGDDAPVVSELDDIH
jgi:hypothetical protein